MGGSGGLCESCRSAGYCTIVSLLGVETLCWMGLEGLVSFFRSGWDGGPGGFGGSCGSDGLGESTWLCGSGWSSVWGAKLGLFGVFSCYVI